jgi:carbon-monoxide dehydrogenase medium subunit/6-hydroxypseudooxynicotine dehydrogenase subunit alpha
VKPAPFEYFAPTSTEEALELLAQDPDESKVLAGGQSLVPMMNFRLARPERLIDLNRIEELDYIERRNGDVVIGAMTRHVTVERSDLLADELPLLRQAIRWVGHEQIRNRGTMGGSIAHADPAAELSAALAALDARVRVRSTTGERVLHWSDFFVFGFMTALEPDEIVVEVEVPALPSTARTGFVEFARRHGDFALGGAAVVLVSDAGGVCQEARISLLAAAPMPVRAARAEELLSGSTIDASVIAAAADAAITGVEPTGDIHGSTKYRVKLLRTMAERAIAAAASGPEGELR